MMRVVAGIGVPSFKSCRSNDGKFYSRSRIVPCDSDTFERKNVSFASESGYRSSSNFIKALIGIVVVECGILISCLFDKKHDNSELGLSEASNKREVVSLNNFSKNVADDVSADMKIFFDKTAKYGKDEFCSVFRKVGSFKIAPIDKSSYFVSVLGKDNFSKEDEAQLSKLFKLYLEEYTNKKDKNFKTDKDNCRIDTFVKFKKIENDYGK